MLDLQSLEDFASLAFKMYSIMNAFIGSYQKRYQLSIIKGVVHYPTCPETSNWRQGKQKIAFNCPERALAIAQGIAL